MGDKRARRRSPRNWMHHGGFHFEKSVIRHVIADRLNDAAARHESETRRLVHDQIEMAHTVFLFLIGQSVEFFRQWPQRF